MVIPVGGPDDGGAGGGLGMNLVGPPPDFLLPRFMKIKACLVVLISSLVVKIISGTYLLPGNWINWVLSSLNAILNSIIGIFLLKDFPPFGKWHACLVQTFCSSCQEGCQGGMSCLCTWFFCCMITAVFGLIPAGGSDIQIIILLVQVLIDPEKYRNETINGVHWYPTVESSAWYVALSLFTASMAFALLAQLIGGYQGYKGFHESQQLGPPTGGDWAQDGGGGGTFGGGYGGGGGAPNNRPQNTNWGGGQALGGGGGGGNAQQASVPPARPGAPTPNFTTFQGAGHRLGG